MSKVHVVIPDPHAHYRHNNDRAIWLGNLIRDIRPDVVVNMGDTADMPSLSGYDRGKRSFQGRTYAADIAAHGDFQERLWGTVRAGKKKLPRRITLIGNHEQRIDRAINIQPELAGTVDYKDLCLDKWYDDVVHYVADTPGVINVDGIHYAHYFISGVMGRAIGGEHPAHALLTHKHVSCTQAHSHILDRCIRTRADGRKILGLVVGVYQDYWADWAGEANRLWTPGVMICRDVEDGHYNDQWIGIEALRREYGRA